MVDIQESSCCNRKGMSETLENNKFENSVEFGRSTILKKAFSLICILSDEQTIKIMEELSKC